MKKQKTIKHFLNVLDYSQKELKELVSSALKFKKGIVDKSQLCKGKSLGLLFFNPSLRSRTSLTRAMYKLAGNIIDIAPSIEKIFTLEFEDGVVMNKGTIEHVKDASRTLSRYVDAIAIRASDLITNSSMSANAKTWDYSKKDTIISSFAKYATVPIVNMESNVWHPCQGLGDMVTITEKIKKPKGKKYVLSWAYHPKALPMATPNSQILSAVDLGMDVTVVYPKGWELDKDIIGQIKKRSQLGGGSLSFSNSQEEAFKDADVVCVKSWGALKYYENWKGEGKLRAKLKNWIVDKKKMSLTKNAFVMHCLPVRRGVELTDEVLDSKKSLIIDQAENRMWAQMSLLSKILKDNK